MILTILYSIECWVVKKQYIYKMGVIEVRILGWICPNTRKDRIWNAEILLKISVAPIVEKMRESIDGLVIFKEKWLILQWEEVSWYKLSGWKKDIEKKNTINKSSKKECQLRK